MRPIDSILDISRFTPAAHRGASRERPENTLEAFARALEIQPRCLLETDVRRTAEGRAVLRHDRMLETTTDGHGPVDALTLDGLKGLDAGHAVTFDGGVTHPFRGKGYRIATLEDALEAFPDSLFSIDIKDRDTVFADTVITIIRNQGAEGRVIVGSFHGGVISHLRRTCPGMVRHAGFGEAVRFLVRSGLGIIDGFRPREHAFFLPEYHFGPSPERTGRFAGVRILSRRFIADAHRKGIPVFAWTINEKENMRRLMQWGVNGIVTDFPDRLREVMEEMAG